MNKKVLEPQQKVAFNHLEFHRELSIKSMLLSNLEEYCEIVQMNKNEIVPQSFIIDFESEFLEKNLKDFCSVFYQFEKQKNLEVIELKEISKLVFKLLIFKQVGIHHTSVFRLQEQQRNKKKQEFFLPASLMDGHNL
eukprot:TRINITY_DN50634_c0_g1_i1.p1 TRINITY_DN50634_c0_g1~~TRINITY_DN50634_c0_g1_i1.p1  ORF type:complete len:137 (+),score=20.07 TRINITY_DN50634_c0_g1_i1:378-788(+)